MESCDNTLVVDLGLSQAPTPCIDNGALGIYTTTSTPLPSHTMHVDTSNAHIPQDKVISIHEDLAHLQQNLCLENISTTKILAIYNIHQMLESDEGLDVMKQIVEIYKKHAPSPSSTSQPTNIIVIQGGSHIPPPSTIASIPTFTTPQVTTTMQQASHVTPFTIPNNIRSSFVASNVPSSTTFTSLSVLFNSPNITYNPSPFSLPPHTTYTKPLITQLF